MKIKTKLFALLAGTSACLLSSTVIFQTTLSGSNVTALESDSSLIYQSGIPSWGASYFCGEKKLGSGENSVTWYLTTAGNSSTVGWKTSDQNQTAKAVLGPIANISESTKYGAYQTSNSFSDAAKIIISIANSDSVSGSYYIWTSTNSGSTWNQAVKEKLTSATNELVFDAGSSLGNGVMFAFGFGCSKTTKTRISIKNISVYKELEDQVMPTSVSVSLSKGDITEIGSTVQATATVLPEDATNKSVIWSSSDENVATVDKDSGLVTVTGNGTAEIIATCVANSEITGKGTIVVNDTRKFIETDAYLTTDSLNVKSNSYANNDGSHSFGSNSYTTKDVLCSTTSSKKDWLQLKKSSGTISNDRSYQNAIKTISIKASSKAAVYVGENKQSLTTIESKEVDDYYVYDATKISNSKYFQIANTTDSVLYINVIIIELDDTDVEEVRAFASLFNGEMEPMCSTLKGIDNDSWLQLKETYELLSDEQKAILTNASLDYIYTEISKCVQRYDYIVSKYSNLDNFMNRDVQTNKASMIIEPGSDKSAIALVTLLVTFTISSVGLFFFLKKRKEA